MSRKPKCKSCVYYDKQSSGIVICASTGQQIEPESYVPIVDGRTCYAREVKPELTQEQLHEIRSAAGRKGGLKKRGRVPKGQMQVNAIDLKVFSAYATKIQNDTRVATFHKVAQKLVEKYPELKPLDWID